MLANYQKNLIECALRYDVLQFGDFTLKSGRKSPYFFNSGLFNTGEALNVVAEAFVQTMLTKGIRFDVLFGPAYKGIPLVATIAQRYYQTTGEVAPWTFNRKEAKAHGEGGVFVGSDLRGRVTLIDDVTTAGTAVRESLALMRQSHARITDFITMLNRQEYAPNTTTPVMTFVETQYGIRGHAIITLDDLMQFVEQDADLKKHITALTTYRSQFT